MYVRPRVIGIALAIGLGTAFAAPAPAGAASGIYAITKVTVRNDTPNPVFVLFDFLTIPNDKEGGWVGVSGGTIYATHIADYHFLTHVHVYIKPEGQQSESAPTTCYLGASYVNSADKLRDLGGHFKIAIHYDAQRNTCWLENYK